jgi:hypothetical protein
VVTDKDGTHFWLMAFAKNGRFSSACGTITPQAGWTRLDVHNLIRDDLFGKVPELRDASVIAFDLQPNKI